MSAPKLTIHWQQVEEIIVKLSDRLKADGFIPDFVVGISRGGYFPAIFFNLRLCQGWSPVCYFDIDRDLFDPKVRIVKGSTFSADTDLRGKKVLLCEDMLETGESMRVVKKWLQDRGALVKTVSLFAHPDSTFEPDYIFNDQLTDEPSFPWERFREMDAGR